MKHTPTPYRRGKSNPLFICNAKTGNPVADVRREISPTHNRNQKELDEIADKTAAFIVRACNCFDELLAACKSAAHMIPSTAPGSPRSPMMAPFDETAEQLNAIIAKAEAAS